jgi:hypothetical protein
MSPIRCPGCSTEVSGSELTCPSCKFPLSKLGGLSAAILTKNPGRVAGLIQLGADVNAVDTNGRTPLMIAAAINSVEIVQMLLAAGANPEFINTAGETALSIAQSREVERIIRRAIVVTRFTSHQKSAQPTPQTYEAVNDPMEKRQEKPDVSWVKDQENEVEPLQVEEEILTEELEPEFKEQKPVETLNPSEVFGGKESKRAEGSRYFVPAMIGLCFLILILVLTWPQGTKSLAAHASRSMKPVGKILKPQVEQPQQPVQENKIAVLKEPKKEEPKTVEPIPPPEVKKTILTSPSKQKTRASVNRSPSVNEEQAKIRLGRALNSQGFALIQNGRPGEAIPVLEKSLRSFPKGTNDVYYAYAMFNLGVAWRKAGRPDLAIPILERRIRINNQREVVARELRAARQQAKDEGFDPVDR